MKFPSFKYRPQFQNHVFLGEMPDMDILQGNEIGIITGELIVMNIDEPPQEIGTQYIPQFIRESQRKDLSIKALSETSTKVYSAIHPGVVRYIENHKKTRLILAMDAIIAFAKSYKADKTLLICTGYETQTKTYFITYLFNHGQLIRITETIIRPHDHARYAADVREQIKDAIIEYPNAHIILAPPLSPVHLDHIETEAITNDIYNGKFPVITTTGEVTPSSPKLPIAITAFFILACIGWSAYILNNLQNSTHAYSNLTKSNDTPTTDIEILQSRATWEQAIQSPEKSSLQNAQHLIAAIAQNPGWRLQGISIDTRRPSEENAAFNNGITTSPLSIKLTVPYNAQIPLHEQAYNAITQLSKQTGLQLVVERNGLSVQDQHLHIDIESI